MLKVACRDGGFSSSSGKFNRLRYIFISIVFVVLLSACNAIEKASMHGFDSGYYKFESEKITRNVYADISAEKIDVYSETDKQPDTGVLLSVSLLASDSNIIRPMVFRKQSLDIDLTAILLKYRPSVYGLPGQMTTDFNIAIYAGWRHDNYSIKGRINPLGRRYPKVIHRGYDFGFFGGPGATLISPFTTQNNRTDEYSGMIVQYGIAGFIESNSASFGIALGLDYLLNSDRQIWIYQNKPWVGFIVGVALN